MAFLERLLQPLKDTHALKTALDTGCGVGYFSRFLADREFQVTGVDGRAENAREASARHKDIAFLERNIEAQDFRNLGSFDLCLCFGLLYHLENPMQAVRNLFETTGKILIVETMIAPGSGMTAVLRDEGRGADQALAYAALVLSEEALTAALYRAGFPHVYSMRELPDHADFRECLDAYRSRTVLAASKVPLANELLVRAPNPQSVNHWQKPDTYARRLIRFLRRPWSEKVASVRHKVRRTWLWLFPNSTWAVRLPYGGWWLAQNDTCSEAIAMGSFEVPEWRFVDRFLKDGMTVLDIGAHCGFYSMLASKRVGSSGRVIAFEPSPRERTRLERNLKRNGCTNVRIEPFALSCEVGVRELFLVEGSETGCNSLKPPALDQPTKSIHVEATTLDHYLRNNGIERVDFVKLDVEGGERDVLRGARTLFEKSLRPVILCEVDEQRTASWSYRSNEILSMVGSCGYRWFGLTLSGDLTSLEKSQSYNFVAVPEDHPISTSHKEANSLPLQMKESASLPAAGRNLAGQSSHSSIS
jgi:FkbM family methyltransferase